MPCVTVDQLKEQLAFTADIGAIDDGLLLAKIVAAQGYIQGQLGYAITQTPPLAYEATLCEAVLQLAAYWYENRGDGVEQLREMPFGVSDIVNTFREWTF